MRRLLIVALGTISCQSAPAPIPDPTPPPPVVKEAPATREAPPMLTRLTLDTPATLPNGYTLTLRGLGHKHGKGFTTSRFEVTLIHASASPVTIPYSYTDGTWMFEAQVEDFAVTITTSQDHYQATLTQPLDPPPPKDALDDRAQDMAAKALEAAGCQPGVTRGGWTSPGTYAMTVVGGADQCSVTVGVFSGISQLTPTKSP